jgi:hypothetical protein
MSFALLLRGRITWTIFDHPSADSQWHSSMPFQLGISNGPNSFCTWGCDRSRRYPVSVSSWMGPMSWSFCCSLLKAAGSQPAPATAAVGRTCLTSACALTVWQWVHSPQHGRRERASALFVSSLDRAQKWSYTVASAKSCMRFVLRGSLKQWARLMQSGRCASGTLVHRDS